MHKTNKTVLGFSLYGFGVGFLNMLQFGFGKVFFVPNLTCCHCYKHACSRSHIAWLFQTIIYLTVSNMFKDITLLSFVVTFIFFQAFVSRNKIGCCLKPNKNRRYFCSRLYTHMISFLFFHFKRLLCYISSWIIVICILLMSFE